jgi:YD repeat-containing protein
MMQTGRVAVGHPVDVASGAVFTIKEDFRFPGMLDLVWRRRYDSDTTLDSWLGRGWGVPFFITLERVPEGYLLTAQAGHTVLFPAIEPLGEGGILRNLYSSMELRREANSFSVLHWHAGGSPITRWTFPAWEWGTMPLASLEDAAGRRIMIRYDERVRPRQVVQELEQRVVDLDYGQDGLISVISLVADDGNRRPLVRYEYDDQRHLLRATDSLGYTAQYAYDRDHRLIAERNALGSTFSFQYDSLGRCVLASGDNGYMRRRLRYYSAPQLTRVEDSLGNVSQYFFNESGQVTQEISPIGATTTFRYDEYGRQVEILYADAAVERFEYDERGDRTKVVHEDGTATTMRFNERHQLSEVTDPVGATSTYTYDERGNVLALTNALGAEFSCVRDERGMVTEVRTPGGLIETRLYDPRLRWVECRDQIGLIQRVEVNEYGREAARFDAAGLVHRTQYDLMQRPTDVEDAMGVHWLYKWNGIDEITEQTSTNGERDAWEYDIFGQVISQTNPLGVMRCQYDTEGNLIALENRAGELMQWVYDAAGRLSASRVFDGRSEQYEHNPRGDCIRIIRSDGREVHQSFDLVRQLTRRTSSDGLVESFKYDGAGRLLTGRNNDTSLEFEYDLLGRVTAEIQNGRRLDYAYDADNNRTVRRLPVGGGDELAFRYDVRGRLVAFGNAEGTIQELAWDEIDRLVERRLSAQLREEFRYGPTRSLQRQEVRSSKDGVVVSRDYEYEERGYVAAVRDDTYGIKRYTYDVIGRLTSVRGGAGPDERYDYNPVGAIRETHRGPRVLVEGGRTRSTTVSGSSRTTQEDVSPESRKRTGHSI